MPFHCGIFSVITHTEDDFVVTFAFDKILDPNIVSRIPFSIISSFEARTNAFVFKFTSFGIVVIY